MPLRYSRGLSVSKATDAVLQDIFYCPGCSTWRSNRPKSAAKRVALSNRRHNSTLVSSTAVNAAKKIPARYRELHDALQNLQKKAPAQVNQSRLQLALSSLESERPVTRVAILGINKSTTVRRIIRLLLADSLVQEQAWEKQLVPEDERETAAILIRYGEPISSSIQPTRSALPTISIPAPILQQNNIEILVSSVFSPDDHHPAIESDVFLTPFAGTPTSTSGRQTIVSYPVHKTLVLADGLDELQSLSRMLALANYGVASEKVLIDSMVNLDGTNNTLPSTRTTVLDVLHVERDLQKMRESMEHATAFEVSRSGSNIPRLGEWLQSSAISADGTGPKTLVRVIKSILDGATVDIEQQAAAAITAQDTSATKIETRARLQEAIDEFLKRAHQELQIGLARAWESREWHKLSWYSLIWRVDDVPLIVTDIAQRHWLRESSLVVFEMLGRLHQAGLVNFVSYDGRMVEFATTDGDEIPAALRPTTPSTSADYLEVPDQPILKSSELTRARQTFLATTIPTMTATAQRSLFKAIGFSSSAAALSALTYVSTLTPSIYECGAILALGVVFSLRRLQKQWESCRSNFQRDLLDVGRTALKSTEEFMRFAVREGGRKPVDQVEVDVQREAQAAVDKARRALEQIK